MSAPAIAKRLWAPISSPTHGSDWPMWNYIRTTRREAKAAHLGSFDPEHHKAALKRVRFARVTITEDTTP